MVITFKITFSVHVWASQEVEMASRSRKGHVLLVKENNALDFILSGTIRKKRSTHTGSHNGILKSHVNIDKLR